jgi:hypothetical protein
VTTRQLPNGVAFYGRDRHLSFFRPVKSHGRYSEWGFHYKRRGRDGTWKHQVLRLFEKATPLPGGKGCWKCEWSSYRTKKAKGHRTSGNRLTIKRFVRLKVGYGGSKRAIERNSK